MVQRALITGISGFVGGFLAEHLLESGDRVLGCSPDGTWMETSPPEIQNRVELFAWDLSSERGLSSEAFETIARFRPTALYHLAALSVPEDCGLEEPNSQAIAVNVDGTRRALELAARLASRPRVLLASTSQVYAAVTPESSRVDENAPLKPRRGYGKTKLAAEAQTRDAIDRHGCDAVISRAFQHSGPRQNPRMMLSQWAYQFAAGGNQPVKVYTRGAHIDMTDVRDVVRAYRLLVEHGRTGEVYNVGSGIPRLSGEILEILRNLADPERVIVELRPGVKHDPVADITRLVRATGWQPAITVEQTVADTLAYWREFLARRK